MKVNISKDPDKLGQSIVREITKKLVLGLDLGSSTGYSMHYYEHGDPMLVLPKHMGQLDLSAGPYDSGAIRFVRLRQFLTQINPDMVFYEDVKNNPAGIAGLSPMAAISRASTAAELIGSFKATVCTWAEEFNVPCAGFGIGTIKKRATGKGNANKEEVIKACNALFGSDFEVEGYENTGVDNIADSCFVLLLGLEQYGAGLVGKKIEVKEHGFGGVGPDDLQGQG